MPISKAATISVLVTLALVYFGIAPGIAFLVGGVGVIIIYRGIKGCFNFFSPPALTGAGVVVLVYNYTENPLFALVSGLVVSVMVGMLSPL